MAIKGTSEDFSYAAALKTLRDKIALPELEIATSHIRRSANGGMIIEIPGKDKSEKADKLKDRIVEVLGETATVTLRPTVGRRTSEEEPRKDDPIAEQPGMSKEV